MSGAPLGADEFTSAFAHHGRTLWVLASAWVGRGDADDLVQETARVAWQRRAQFATGGDPGPWLATIARQLGANWRRKRHPQPHDPSNLPDAPAGESVPQATWPFDVDRAGLPDDMWAALSALPETARACLLLQVVVGMTFAEIGKLLGLPENTASSHARRARLALRNALRDVDAAPAEAIPRTT